MDDLKTIKTKKKTIKRQKTRGDKKIKSPLIRLVNKRKKRTRKKQREAGNFNKSIISSFFPPKFKSDKEKNPGRLRMKDKQKMEGMFFKGLRSDYITRKALNEVNQARKNEDINAIIDIGKVLLQREERQERCLKRFHENRTRASEREPEKTAKISYESLENLEDCSLSPISELTSTFVEDQTETILRTQNDDLEKELKIFSETYEETVGNTVLHHLPANGVLEDALNALRKLRLIGQTDLESVTKEFKGNETVFSKEFKFPVKDFEGETPAAEDFINKFIFSDNLLPKTDCYYESFYETGKSFPEELDDEFQYYHPLSFQPTFYNDSANDIFKDFSSQSKNLESSAKDLTITTPPIQFYRRNMF